MDFISTIGLDAWVWLAIAAFLSGFIDAVVGGGGLVLVPSLFAAFPTALPATLLGTNKLAGVFGTATSAYQYSKRTAIPLLWVCIAAVAAFLAAILGAASVQYLPVHYFRKLLPLVLLGLLVYTLLNKNLGLTEKSPATQVQPQYWAILLGLLLGFYDGVFGPGTGSFLVFLWIRWFGLTFISASASAKFVNLACNLGALVWFVPAGHFIFKVSAWMVLFTMTGALLGARFALKNGNIFVRKVFVCVVVLLIVKSSYDAYFK